MCILKFLPTVDAAKSKAWSFVSESAKAGKKQNIVQAYYVIHTHIKLWPEIETFLEWPNGW